MYIYLLPLIAALIGWITNFLAIKMLFHPRKPVNLFLFTLQGIFPKRQKALAEKLGNIVSKELFSIQDIKSAIENKDSLETINQTIDQHIDNFLKVKLVETMPMLGMFMNDDLLAKIKTTLMTEISQVMPEVIEKFVDNIEKKVNVEAIVYEKVVNFSSDKLEEILYSIMKKEFRFIEFIGAVLGFIIGVIQVLLVKYL